MFKYISFLFVFIFSYTGYSQVYFESNSIIKENIIYTELPEEGYGKKLYSLLGTENNIDIQKISFGIKARLLVRISRDFNQKITAKISLTRVNFKGNITIRDFNVDSLLWPSGYTASLILNNGLYKHDTINISGLASGQQLKLDLTDYISNTNELRATITEIQFNYKETQYQQLQELNSTVSYYYSYGKLLNNLLSRHHNHSINNNQSVEEIFIDKIEINRATNHIKQHNFSHILNLDKNDPVEFLKQAKKLYRLSNRAATLFNQQISTTKTNTLVPHDFCRYYCELSMQYLSLGKQLQPDDASAYIELATIDLTKNAKENLSLIIDFYNQNKSTKSAEMCQCIYTYFVNTAKMVIIDDNYTDALLLLNNSFIIQNWAGIVNSSDYISAVATVLDGISSSYLSVGNTALSMHNKKIAPYYFSKADNVFKLNHNLITDVKLPDTAFANYLKLQYEIALKYIGLCEFELALERLSHTENICLKLPNSNACTNIDSALFLAHSGNLKFMLDTLEQLITNGQYPDAFKQLLLTKKYINKNTSLNYDNNRFDVLSYSLFLEYLQRGEILIDAKQPIMALDNLLKAKSIQQYLNQNIIELNRLIKLAAEPIIVQLIDEAKYHIWANRMDEAALKNQEAVKLNNQYFSNNNSIINQLLNELSIQMQLRVCFTHELKYSDAITKARIVIKNNQFNKLGALLNEAEIYIVKYPQCNIQNYEIMELRDKYSSVLIFYKKYNDISEELFNKGYIGAINQYISLIEYYNYNNLFHYNIYFPNLKEFITKQKLPVLTMATAEYYLENDNLKTSLQYVWLFKNQGGSYKSIARIAKKLAKAIAILDNKLQKPIKESLLEYTLGDSWFNNFKSSYLMNRVINSVR